MELTDRLIQFSNLGTEREAQLRKQLGGPAAEYLSEYRFYVHEGDLRIADHVSNPGINLIVTGNLIIDGVYHDGFNGGILIVAGSMWAKHVLSHSAMCIGGDLWVQGMILQYYPDWCFTCDGILCARAFLNRNKLCSLDVSKAIIESCDFDDCYSAIWGDGPSLFDLLSLDVLDVKVIIDQIWAAEAAGRSPFSQAEELADSASPNRLRRLLYPKLEADELMSWTATHAFDVAARSIVPAPVMALLLSHFDARVRAAAAAAPWLDEAGIVTLASDVDEVVRTAIASRVTLALPLQTRLASDTSPMVRCALVYFHTHAQSPWLDTLAADANIAVRRAVATVPQLPAEMVNTLLQDSDSVVRRRILKRQQVDTIVWRTLLSSPDVDIRTYLAQAAVKGEQPFGDDLGARQQVLMHFLLDADPAIREKAAVDWLPFSFYDEHAEAFAQDEVNGVRYMLALRTHRSDLLAKLSKDPCDNVMEAVAKHPLTPAATLLDMANKADRDMALHLMDNPALPEEVVHILYQSINELHANTSFIDILNKLPQRLLSDDPRRDVIYREKKRFSTHDPSVVEQENIMRALLVKPSYQLQRSLLNSRHYPADLLDAYVVKYLRSKCKDGRYDMADVAANPALWESTLRKIGMYLHNHADYELLKGLVRNPEVPADVLAALAYGMQDESDRYKAAEASWLWHGLKADDWPALAAGAFEGIDWKIMEVAELDVADTVDEAEPLIEEGNTFKDKGKFTDALACFEQVLQVLDKGSEEDYRRMYARYMVMYLCKELVRHQDDVAPGREAALREQGLAMAQICLDSIDRNAIMPFTVLGKLEKEVIRYAQHFFALDAFMHSVDSDVLGDALTRIDDALGYPLDAYEVGTDNKDLRAIKAKLQVKMGMSEQADKEVIYAILRDYPMCEDFGSLAGDALRRLTAENDGDVDYWVGLGDFCRREELHDEGIDAYTRALTLMQHEDFDRDDAINPLEEMFCWRGRLYANNENFSAALSDFNQSIEINNGWAFPYSERGWVYFKTKDMPLALADFQRAHALDVEDVDYLEYVFHVLSELERYVEAIPVVQCWLDIERSADALNAMACAHFNTNNVSAALQFVEEALEQDEEIAVIWGTKAEILLTMGKAEAALVCSERSLQLDPNDAELQDVFGQTCHALGKSSEATAALERTRALEPDSDWLDYALRKKTGAES